MIDVSIGTEAMTNIIYWTFNFHTLTFLFDLSVLTMRSDVRLRVMVLHCRVHLISKVFRISVSVGFKSVTSFVSNLEI